MTRSWWDGEERITAIPLTPETQADEAEEDLEETLDGLGFEQDSDGSWTKPDDGTAMD